MSARVMPRSRGADNGCAILTESQVRDAHARAAGGESCRSIADSMGVTLRTIRAAVGGETWAHLGLPKLAADRVVRLAPARQSTRRVSDVSRYEDDAECIALVDANPDGMALAEIGEALGVTRERARQIEQAALDKLRAASARYGISPGDLAAILAGRGRSHADRAAEFAVSDAWIDADRRVYDHSNTPITDGPLVELETLLADVEARAEFVDDVTRIARRHA